MPPPLDSVSLLPSSPSTPRGSRKVTSCRAVARASVSVRACRSVRVYAARFVNLRVAKSNMRRCVFNCLTNNRRAILQRAAAVENVSPQPLRYVTALLYFFGYASLFTLKIENTTTRPSAIKGQQTCSGNVGAPTSTRLPFSFLK